jgi:hypothetical protein
MPNLTRDILTKPTLPTLGTPPYWFNDPTFGHRIVRVTDENATAAIEPGYIGGSYHPPGASMQRMWNSDSTRFFVTRNEGSTWLYDWNAATMTATLRERLKYNSEPSFSRVDPRYIYGRSSTHGNAQTITRGDTSQNPIVYTVLVDAEVLIPALVGAGTYLANIFTADNGAVQFSTGGASQDYTHYVVWYPVDNPGNMKILDSRTRSGMFKTYGVGPYLHASFIDLSGRYTILSVSGFQGRTDVLWIWDAVADTVAEITAAPGGHMAVGDGWVVNGDVFSGPWDAGQWIYRECATPNSGLRQLISPVLTPQQIYCADHGNCNTTHSGDGVKRPYYAGLYRYYDGPYNIEPAPKNLTPWRAWDDEIIAIPTDTSGGPVVRYAHHRSYVWPEPVAQRLQPFEFWAIPIINPSPDGRWIAFQSNWEHTLGISPFEVDVHRRDLFILDLGIQAANRDARVRGRRTGGGRVFAR